MSGINIAARGGKRPVLDYQFGELVQVKRLAKLGNSKAVIIPVEWLRAVLLIQGKPFDKVGITYNEAVLTIRPYFEEEEGGQS